MTIKWKIAAGAVVVLLLAELVAYFYFSPPVGGPITNGAWAGSNNYFCSLDDGVMFVDDHHIISTDGKKSQQTVWTDLAGTSEDPRIIMSMSRTARTEDGYVFQAHISGDRLTFSSIAPSINGVQATGDVGLMGRILGVLQEKQPWRRCTGITKPTL